MNQPKITHHDSTLSRDKTARWRPLRLVALLSLLLSGLPAQAADYEFSPSGQLPIGCSIELSSPTTTYNCGVLSLEVGDTIAVESTEPVTVIVTGAFTTAEGNLINNFGNAGDLNLVTTGVLTLGADTILNANVSSTAAVNMGIGSRIGGNLTASTVAGIVTLGANSFVGGFIQTDEGAINVGNGSITGGGVISTGAGVVTIGANVNIGGGIASVAGAITINDGSIIGGSVMSTGAGVITMTTNIQIRGNINSVAGAITVGSGSAVAGDITTTGAGVVTLTNVLVGGRVETGAGAITLTDSRVGGAVFSTGAGVVTITNSVIEDVTYNPPCVIGTVKIGNCKL